jgi:transposase
MTSAEYEHEIDQRDEEIKQRDKKIKQLKAENSRLKKLLDSKAKSKTAKTPNFSLDKNNRGNSSKNTSAKKPGKPKGRKKNSAKRPSGDHQYSIYWDDADKDRCMLKRHQFVWHIIDGQAVLVQYDIYDLPDSKDLPVPSGVRNSRSAYGIDVILILAFLHYWTGISLDKACDVMQFFTKLELSKSQADSLLNQLSGDWKSEYDNILMLIALQTIVYIDETGWKVGSKPCYTWCFSTPLYILFKSGVGRGKSVAEGVLGENFQGIGVTDDYCAYINMFTEHQLCWAHLIRKAINIALQNPDDIEFSEFLDQLCAIYYEAIRSQKDGRLSSGRTARRDELKQRITELCTRVGESTDDEDAPSGQNDFVLLQNELTRNIDCLFVFVEHPEVEPTNNRSERNVRREAEVRKGGRTSKTQRGASRRGIVMTVLATLQTRFKKFTLDVLMDEVQRWIATGSSLFKSELADLQNAPDGACPTTT